MTKSSPAGRPPGRGGVRTHAVIGFVHPGEVRTEFCTSLLAVAMQGNTRIDQVIALESGPNISTARNLVAADFLANQRAPWLLMCDTDMAFAADALDRLIAAAHPTLRPIVGALCYSPMNGEVHPTMYELVPKGEGYGFVRPQTVPDDQLVRLSATGTGFLLMHRSALEKVRATSGDQAAPWFREAAVPGEAMALMGEDLTFCLRAGAADVPIHVHTGVQVGHVKSTMLGKVI